MIRGVILDLDGTVYRGNAEVPGAARFIRFLAGAGLRYLFVTNRANRSPSAVAAQLEGFGIPCDASHVLTSAQATARFLKPGAAYWIGESGLSSELEQAGFRFDDASPDYVIVSFDREFNYAKLKLAARLILRGARFIATNPDRALKLDEGVVPGTGSIVAAVTAATGVEPLVIGKPETRIMEAALRAMELPAAEAICIGDNVETDLPAGLRAGIRTAMILTGVSTRADVARAPKPPTWQVDTYEELERIVAADLGAPSP